MSLKQVFILGAPRSGNTLCAALLNKHPAFFIMFESNIFLDKYKKWTYLQKKSNDSIKNFIALFENFSYSQRYQIDLNQMTALFSTDMTWGDMLGVYMEHLLKKIKPTAIYWGDKTPQHVGNVFHIWRELQNVKFIHIAREPRDVISSMSNPSFIHASNNIYVNREAFRLFDKVYQNQKNKIPQRCILEVDYAELVDTPEVVAEKMCVFLGVDYNPVMLKVANTKIRELIGWETDKCWDEIKKQPLYMPPPVVMSNRKKPQHLFYQVKEAVSNLRAVLWFNLTLQVGRLIYYFKYPGFNYMQTKPPCLKRFIRGKINKCDTLAPFKIL